MIGAWSLVGADTQAFFPWEHLGEAPENPQVWTILAFGLFVLLMTGFLKLNCVYLPPPLFSCIG